MKCEPHPVNGLFRFLLRVVAYDQPIGNTIIIYQASIALHRGRFGCYATKPMVNYDKNLKHPSYILQTHPVLEVFQKKSMTTAPSKCSSNSCAITASDELQNDLLHDALARNTMNYERPGAINMKGIQSMTRYDA